MREISNNQRMMFAGSQYAIVELAGSQCAIVELAGSQCAIVELAGSQCARTHCAASVSRSSQGLTGPRDKGARDLDSALGGHRLVRRGGQHALSSGIEG